MSNAVVNPNNATLSISTFSEPNAYWPPSFVSFERGQKWLREADLLLFRSPGLIAWAGRGVHWHAATVSRWNGDWFALETRPGGGRAVPLRALVERAPKRIDVFRPNPDGRWPEYRPDRAVALTRRAIALRYGWRSVLTSVAARLPFVRYLFAETYFDDAALRFFPNPQESRPQNADEREDDNANVFNDLIKFPTKEAPRETARSERRCQRRPETANDEAELTQIVKKWRETFPRKTLQCAELRALADRFAGVDPTPFLSDRFVEPSDLARSSFYRYQFSFDFIGD